MEPFIIFKTSWMTQRKGLEDRKEKFLTMDYTILTFLQDNGLVTEKIIDSFDEVNDDTELRSDQLTDEGLEFMKTGYQKWLAQLDRGGDPSNTKLLQKYLDKLRGK